MRKLGILIVLAAVVGMFSINTSFASADGITIDPNNPEATTISLQDVAKVDISKVRVNAEYVGEWTMVDKTSVNWKTCFWTKPGERWTNSATGVGFYPEWTRAKLCKSSESSTGWVKVAGGKTGSPCFNEAIPPFKHQPKLKKKRVLDVKSLNNFGFKVHAHAGASIDAQGVVACPSGSFSVGLHSVAGTKSGGWFRVKIASRVLIKNHGKVNGRVKVAIRNALRAQLAAEAAAEALGTLTYKCGHVTVTPPPPSTCQETGTCPPPPPPPAPENPSCRYLASPEHVYPGMSRWIDLECNASTYQVSVNNASEWRGFVTFIEGPPPGTAGKWRFKYTAPSTWGGYVDSGNFFPKAQDGSSGEPVPVSVQTPQDEK